MSTLEQQIDDAAQQMKNVKQAGEALLRCSQDIAAALDEACLSLRVLQSKSFFQNDRTMMAEFNKLETRIDRLRELRNMMELGSFSIQIDRAMQTAWEKLP